MAVEIGSINLGQKKQDLLADIVDLSVASIRE
jgi:hypothetical protein